MSLKFPKKEKLKSKNQIDLLFATGKSVKHYPLTMVYLPLDNSYDCHQAGFSVGKKRFKKAVDRNRVKRMIKEAYRLEKVKKLESLENKYSYMFIYLSSKELEWKKMTDAMSLLISKFIEAQKGNE